MVFGGSSSKTDSNTVACDDDEILEMNVYYISHKIEEGIEKFDCLLFPLYACIFLNMRIKEVFFLKKDLCFNSNVKPLRYLVPRMILFFQ